VVITSAYGTKVQEFKSQRIHTSFDQSEKSKYLFIYLFAALWLKISAEEVYKMWRTQKMEP
jgi:hypothetical protein